MPGTAGFLAAFLRHGQERPDDLAVRFDRGPGGRPDEASYVDLDRSARAVAATLAQHCRPGDRVLLSYPAGIDFVHGLLGCFYAGAVPVPVPLPDPKRSLASRSDSVIRNCAPAVVLTDRRHLDSVTAWAGGADLRRPVAGLATDGPLAGPDDWTGPRGDPDGLALLQYTSGSTSEPRGVMVSHRNLLDNIEVMRHHQGWHRRDRFCSWLPAYHDLGLIAMHLLPLFLGAGTTLLSPVDFLKRPVRWLELISRYGATVSHAPNFAYELCARMVTDEQRDRLDLRRWRCAGNGAEPIDAGTLERFVERFAPAGFRAETFMAGYGLAESTLYVSGTPAGAAPRVARIDPDALAGNALRPGDPGTAVVSCGVPAEQLRVHIVDPATRRVLPDGEIGEVWVRGASVAGGYWGDRDHTWRTFHAVTASGEGDFLRTGDLGALCGGELYITGRLREMLVINGRNLYPHDIEREVRLLDAAGADRACCVFSVPGPPERMVVVQESRSRGETPDSLRERARLIRRGLSERLGLPVGSVVLVRTGRVRRTSSGKIQRTAMRTLFLAGELEALHEEPTRARPPVTAGSR